MRRAIRPDEIDQAAELFVRRVSKGSSGLAPSDVLLTLYLAV